MQLVNMDVDQNTSQEHRQLGPFSPGLNAICGPKASGKTTLLHWLRTMLAENQAEASLEAQSKWPVERALHSAASNGSPQPAFQAIGSLEMLSHGKRFQLAHDRQGRVRWMRAFEPVQRSTIYPEYVSTATGPLSTMQRKAFAGLVAAHGMADTESALYELARELRLDTSVTSQISEQRRRLLDRERELSQRAAQFSAAQFGSTHTDREALLRRQEELLRRRAELEIELQACKYETFGLYASDAPYRPAEPRNETRVTAIEQELRASLLELEQLEGRAAQLNSQLRMPETQGFMPEVVASYGVQLQQLDERLDRWRHTLRDLKAQRERVEHDACDVRLDTQVADHLSNGKEPDPREALRALEAQIAKTRSRLDPSAGGTAAGEMRGTDANSAYVVHRDVHGETRIVHKHANCPPVETDDLPSMLRAMQRDLQAVCQQLSRREASSTAETLKQQSQQLARCEAELLQSVEKLIKERAEVLQKIADEQHLSLEDLTLAVGQWCQCQDHPHLREWLLETESPAPLLQTGLGSGRGPLIAELQRTEARCEQLKAIAQRCRRELRETEPDAMGSVLPRSKFARTQSNIFHDLHLVNQELRQLQDRDRLLADLEHVRDQLSRLLADRPANPFRAAVDRHIIGLLGSMPHASLARVSRPIATTEPVRRYDTLDGVVVEQPIGEAEYQVPAAIVRTALRLAIVGCLAERHQPIPLFLDEALDEFEPALQRAAISHLATIANGRQQIIVMTADEELAQLIRQQQGSVSYLTRSRLQTAPQDINRQLAAYANDMEADKWYRPAGTNDHPRPTTRGEYYLNDRSPVEDLPSIHAAAAARCRALGIDRVGDLLDADPDWLAENLHVDHVSQATVSVWQAEARLLCSVRKLRPFDASVLVGAGIRSPRQLSEMHPRHLFDRVERFLATDRGRRILRSGSSFELSRITAWIASANTGSNRYQRSSLVDNESQRSSRPLEMEDSEHSSFATNEPRQSRTTDSQGKGRVRSGRKQDRSAAQPANRQHPPTKTVRLANMHTADGQAVRLKFFLELSSPVVDAPSIGPRMAGRLEKHGILSVDQLLAAQPDWLADRLNLRRVTAETIEGWQEQARLVCRIPNLRGHDAQLLVACGLTSPEDLAAMDAESLLGRVLAIARSLDGQRILRGSKEPDLNEVVDWIAWAGRCRNLAA